MPTKPLRPGYIHLCGAYRFPANVGVTASCLGRRYPVRIGGQSGSLTLPNLVWGQGRWGKDAPSLTAPATQLDSAVDERIGRIAIRAEESPQDVLDYWGMIGSHNPKSRTIQGAFVGAGVLNFTVPASGLTFLDYVHGLGSPRGPELDDLFSMIDRWFDVLRTWTELFVNQDLDTDHPLRNGGRTGSGLELMTFDGGQVSLPGGNNTISVVVREIKPLSLRHFHQAIRRANADTMPDDAWLLLRDAFGSHRRLRYRRAVIEAGTAVEITLADFNSRVTKFKAKGRPPTLGWYVSRLKERAKLPSNIKRELVDVRNAAIHQNKTPGHEQSWTAVDLARQVLDLHDPLPG
jgi:hypothetical protein